MVSRCGVEPLPRRERFYRAPAASRGFPDPFNWSPNWELNPDFRLTKAAYLPLY